jgi:hypothetical protein
MFMTLKWAMLLNWLSTAGENNSSYQNVKEHAVYRENMHKLPCMALTILM